MLQANIFLIENSFSMLQANIFLIENSFSMLQANIFLIESSLSNVTTIHRDYPKNRAKDASARMLRPALHKVEKTIHTENKEIKNLEDRFKSV